MSRSQDFGKLFSARSPQHSDVQMSEHSDAQESPRPDPQGSTTERKGSKSKDPTYQRTTIYLPKSLHRRLKAAAIAEEREISAVVESLVSDWLAERADR